jgi:hypothetical protein
MKIAITDANIFIDLYELGRLDRPIFGVKYLSCSK